MLNQYKVWNKFFSLFFGFFFIIGINFIIILLISLLFKRQPCTPFGILEREIFIFHAFFVLQIISSHLSTLINWSWVKAFPDTVIEFHFPCVLRDILSWEFAVCTYHVVHFVKITVIGHENTVKEALHICLIKFLSASKSRLFFQLLKTFSKLLASFRKLSTLNFCWLLLVEVAISISFLSILTPTSIFRRIFYFLITLLFPFSWVFTTNHKKIDLLLINLLETYSIRFEFILSKLTLFSYLR